MSSQFNAVFQEIRDTIGFTELGRRLGKSRVSVWNWAIGRHPVTAEIAIAIETATGIDRARVILRPDIFGEPNGAFAREPTPRRPAKVPDSGGRVP
jgi:hypothetical protein